MMATSLLTDCSSVQGSTTSSSSDMMTLTTAASSWCAIPSGTRLRLIRLLRPHSRRILVAPGAVPSYGFSVRGGKEFSTGFFVSNVDRNSEADQKGLKIGDQILRINGFKIDDAIHKEFVQLVSNQERLTLKVRSVGMLPVKDKDHDALTWSVVKTPSISSTPSECSYQSSERTERNHSRNQSERVINVVLNVAPRTKLGLGICKGPEWKPGIFVQFTKEKSVAREAGLRPGDQILTVNSIDFSDVLFSEAVAVMKSSNKLDMTVHTGAGCDLFPGESSGYNSSASSVTGDQSPCWADVKSKRLTSVREENLTQSSSNTWNQPVYANERKARSKSISERSSHTSSTTSSSSSTATNLPIRQSSMSRDNNCNKEINKTIIKLSENGATSINNTFIGENTPTSHTGTIRKSQKETNQDINSNMEGTLKKFTQAYKTTNVLPPPPPLAIPNHTHHHHHHHHQQQQKQSNNHPLNFSNDSLMTSVSNSTASPTNSSSSSTFTKNMIDQDDGDIKIGGVAATMQRYQYANLQLAKLNKAAAASKSGDSSTYSNVNLNMENEKSNSCSNDGGSLSSAITEELKKRKARRQPPSFKEHQNAPHNEMKPLQCDTKRENNNNNHHHHHHHHQHNRPTATSQATTTMTASTTNTFGGNDNHDERGHHHQQQQQQQQHHHKNTTTSSNNNNNNNNTANVVGDQHSALMNEFKQAHKRMFKNGFKECGGVESMQQNRDRKEALLNTTIMDDAAIHRSRATKNCNSTAQDRHKHEILDNRETKPEAHSHIPKPPPFQVANNHHPYNSNTNDNNNNNSPQTTAKANSSSKSLAINDSSTTASHSLNSSQHPSNESHSRSLKTAPAAANNHNANRQTLRLGTVTIGEYQQPSMRREPEKFNFISTQKRTRDHLGDATPTNEALQNELQNTLTRANLRKSNGNSYTEHQRNCPLHQQQQQQQSQQRQTVDCGTNGFSIEEVTKKLQKSSLNEHNSAEMLTKPNNRSTSHGNGTTGVGILKNGNRNSASSATKSIEKSIKFG